MALEVEDIINSTPTTKVETFVRALFVGNKQLIKNNTYILSLLRSHNNTEQFAMIFFRHFYVDMPGCGHISAGEKDHSISPQEISTLADWEQNNHQLYLAAKCYEEEHRTTHSSSYSHSPSSIEPSHSLHIIIKPDLNDTDKSNCNSVSLLPAKPISNTPPWYCFWKRCCRKIAQIPTNTSISSPTVTIHTPKSIVI